METVRYGWGLDGLTVEKKQMQSKYHQTCFLFLKHHITKSTCNTYRQFFILDISHVKYIVKIVLRYIVLLSRKKKTSKTLHERRKTLFVFICLTMS